MADHENLLLVFPIGRQLEVSRNLLLLDDDNEAASSSSSMFCGVPTESGCRQSNQVKERWNIGALFDFLKENMDSKSVRRKSELGSHYSQSTECGSTRANALSVDDAYARVFESGWPFADNYDPAYFIANTSSSEPNNNYSKWNMAALREYSKTGDVTVSEKNQNAVTSVRARISQLETRLANVAAIQRVSRFFDFAPVSPVPLDDFPSGSESVLRSIDIVFAAKASSAVPMKFQRSINLRRTGISKKKQPLANTESNKETKEDPSLRKMKRFALRKGVKMPAAASLRSSSVVAALPLRTEHNESRKRQRTPSTSDNEGDERTTPNKTIVVNTQTLSQADLVQISDPKQRLMAMMAKYNALRAGRLTDALPCNVHSRPTPTISHGACAANRLRDKYLHKKPTLMKPTSLVKRPAEQGPHRTVTSQLMHKRFMQRSVEREKELRVRREERQRKENKKEYRLRKERAIADYAESMRKRTADDNARRDFMRQQVEARSGLSDDLVLLGLQRAYPLDEPLPPIQPNDSLERAHLATCNHREWSEPPSIELFLPVSVYDAHQQSDDTELQMAKELFKNLTIKAFKVARQADFIVVENEQRMFPERPDGIQEGRFRNRFRCKQFNARSRNYVDGCKVSDDRRLGEWKRSDVAKVYDQEIGEAQCMDGTDAECLLKNVMSILLHIPNSSFGDISLSKNDMLRGIQQDQWNTTTKKTGFGRFLDLTLPIRGRKHHLHEVMSAKVRHEKIPSPPGDERSDGKLTPPSFDHDISPIDD